MHKGILVLNAGSSSIKCSLFKRENQTVLNVILLQGLVERIKPDQAKFNFKNERNEVCASGTIDVTEGVTHRDMLEVIFKVMGKEASDCQLEAVGHRVVHGGKIYSEPVVITPEVLIVLKSLITLAPLHEPHNIAAIEGVLEKAPRLLQVACFDTAFHRSQEKIHQIFGLPRALTEEGIQKYGFHGLSYEYISEQLEPFLGKEKSQGRIIVAHLGNGASLCAIHHKKSVASTMGFTALEGLMMGTRCGSIDAGVLLYLLTEKGMTAKEITSVLYQKSGLLGVSGISHDMRILLESAEQTAKEAVDLFCYRIIREIGSLSAAMGGLDAIVFTGGIGEHACTVRAQVISGCAWLGAFLDKTMNDKNGPRISSPESTVSAWVIPTNEEWVIARHTEGYIR